MRSLEKIKRDYILGKEILQRAFDADDKSIRAILIRASWNIKELQCLQKYIESLEDQGIKHTLRKID